MRKILVIGGTSKSIINFRLELLRELKNSGYEVHAAAHHLVGEDLEILQKNGISAHQVGESLARVSPLADIKLLWRYFSLLFRIRPLVFSYTIKPVIYTGLLCQICGLKYIPMITGVGYTMTAGSAGWALRATVMLLYKLSLRRSSAIIFHNGDNHLLFQQRGLIPSRVKCYVIGGSGVDTSYYRYHRRYKNNLTFIMVARLINLKGVAEYFECAQIIKARFPFVEFNLVGPYDASNADVISSELYEKLRSRDIVNYIGHRADIRGLLNSSTVFVLPSHSEGLPRSAIEAGATGMPIITTNAPGCREVVIDGVSGFLFRVGDVNALVNCCMEFVEDRALAPLMGCRSSRYIRKRFDSKMVNRDILNIFESHG